MKQSASAEQPQYSPVRVGFMIFMVLACAVITGFGNYKLIPMQSAIMEYFNVAEGAYGYLNTASNWLTVICAIPMGLLVRKLACNWSVLLGFLCAVLGIFIQTVAKSFPLFVFGRMIEGTGTGMVALVTGSLTLTLVSHKRLSFWSSMMIMAGVIPSVIMTKGGTALMMNSGLTFQQVFRLIGAVYLGCVVVWFIIMPLSLHISGVNKTARPSRERTMRVYRNKDNWLLSIGNIFFSATSIAFTAYIIRFLTMKGIPQAQAANYYSYTTLLGLVSMIAFGIISDRFKTKRKIAIMSFIAGAVAFILLAVLPGNLILIYVFLWGTLPRSLAGLTNAAAADVAEVPTDIPIVTSVKNTITGVGNIVVGILMGYLIQYMGYQFTVLVLAGGMFLGAVCWFLAKRIP